MAGPKLEPFRVEEWMDAYETTAKYNIAETCAASISIDDLYEFAGEKPERIFQYNKKLQYGDIRGSDRLRSNIAALYSRTDTPSLSSENILITSGAIAANFLVLYSLIGRGDHVICHFPTYQQLYSVPVSLGADVDLWRSKEENRWQLNIDDLKDLLRPSTKLIILNNPQNPTGAIVPKSTLEQVVQMAQERGIYVLCDEVYRPLFHSTDENENNPDIPPSVLSIGSYDRVIATGSMSKAYALAGIRIGWVATVLMDLVNLFADARHYTTISVSQIDDQVAAFATSHPCVDNLIARNQELARTNVEILEKFIEDHREYCDWVKPVAGTTAFIRFARDGKPVNDMELCKLLHREEGTFLVPGSLCFGDGIDFKGYVRAGYVCETHVLEEGLERMRNFMSKSFPHVPLA